MQLETRNFNTISVRKEHEGLLLAMVNIFNLVMDKNPWTRTAGTWYGLTVSVGRQVLPVTRVAS